MKMKCSLCPRMCNVDREITTGYCGVKKTLRVARAALHFWEEPCISGEEGSGAVFFTGCNLRCVFCQNFQIARAEQGKEITVERLSEIFLELQEQKANNINLVTATHYVPQVVEALKIAKEKGLHIPVVYNCGGYERVETLRELEGKIDIYLPDLKYADNRLAKALSGAPDYFEVTTAAIREMVRQTGAAVYDENGMMLRGTQIRHLVLPGLTGDSMKILTMIADEFPGVPVSLMGQYTPFGKALSMPGMNRKLKKKEYARVLAHMEAIGLDGYRQELESASEAFVPAFDGTGG